MPDIILQILISSPCKLATTRLSLVTAAARMSLTDGKCVTDTLKPMTSILSLSKLRDLTKNPDSEKLHMA